MPRNLRSDALDNRARILGAARALFAVEGLDVPMRKIARRAGVGPATLYRRFPAKQVLLDEVFAGEVRACHAIVAEGLADADPWQGFRTLIEKICAQHARNRGFTDAFLSAQPGMADAAGREHVLKAIAELARGAKATGHLRADFVLDDLVLVLMANRGINAASASARIAASRRFAALVIRAFQAPAAP